MNRISGEATRREVTLEVLMYSVEVGVESTVDNKLTLLVGWWTCDVLEISRMRWRVESKVCVAASNFLLVVEGNAF
jgi:hypothetical protein